MKTHYSRLILSLFITLPLVVAGCGESPDQDGKTGPESSGEQEAAGSSREQAPDQVPQGTIMGQPFKANRSVLEIGILTIGQGEGDKPDKAVAVNVGDPARLSGRTLSSADSSSGLQNPRLEIRKEGQSFPDTHFVMNNYDLTLSFGESTRLGIPYRVHFVSTGKKSAEVVGRHFATFGDIRVSDGELDRRYDSLETLNKLARFHVQSDESWGGIKEDIGIRMQSYGEPYPKSGVVTMKVGGKNDNGRTLRIQMKKDSEGWGVYRVLEPGQIPAAHPVPLDLERSAEQRGEAEAERAAGQRLETWFAEQEIMESIRTTDVDCDADEAVQRASCRAIYGRMLNGELECMVQTWLLTGGDGSWNLVREIENNQRVNGKTGELESYEPFEPHCS